MADDLLGGGLDIEGWNYIKLEQARGINELVDKAFIHRQMMPLILKNTLPKEMRQEAFEAVVGCIEAKSTFHPDWIAEKIKAALDTLFTPSWHVIVGEDFSFDIDYEDNFLYYLLYGNHGILAWKCGSMMMSEVNHMADPKTKEKLKFLLMNEKSPMGPAMTTRKDFFADNKI